MAEFPSDLPIPALSIEIGSLVASALAKITSFLGSASRFADLQTRLTHHTEHKVKQASFVQCIGMQKPLRLDAIYQSTRLRVAGSADELIAFPSTDTLTLNHDCIVFASPGHGKTIFLHRAFLHLATNPKVIPVLITLRYAEDQELMRMLIAMIAEHLDEWKDELRKKKLTPRDSTPPLPADRKSRLILLVDGYDELDSEERSALSSDLRQFSGLGVGHYILTCRSHYDIIDLIATHYSISPFSEKEAIAFSSEFLGAFGVETPAAQFIEELRDHGFADFVTNPLLLTLTCILKTGALKTLPRTSLGLIRRALDLLTFRWDEQRGIARESRLPLDGEDRIRCLMQIAFDSQDLAMSEGKVFASIDSFLKRYQGPRVNPSALLAELTQWYGVLVPAGNSQWVFVHKTLHDFLAARYWVESGQFTLRNMKKFDSRGAYACCLIPDATAFLRKALIRSADISGVIECLYNRPAFNERDIARIMMKHYEKFSSYIIPKDGVTVNEQVFHNWAPAASDQLLSAVMQIANSGNSEIHKNLCDTVAAEMELRGR